MLTATITIERHDAATNSDYESEITVTGEYYPGARGYATPDDPAEIELLTAKDERGVEIELTDEETSRAEEALNEALSEEIASAEEDRADSIRDRQRDDDDGRYREGRE